MSSIFSKIINRDIPAHIVAEDEQHLAFLDINPVAMGHVLVIPKKEVDYVFDLEDAALSKLHLFAKKVAVALKQAVPCRRVGVAIIGLEVPHAHVHLVPLQSMNDINFTKPKLSPGKAELEQIAERIKRYLPQA
ncbi:HIT family protein [Cesiribacter andamanensis]|uniref:HIT-like protein n=1 Tax=Cesiribacter andamanensis AMV16 TaxID=1279009 RepID=M7N0F6_9BACT|nr:HIT family protein [Cesiribacter andamanensis]EMR00757.1 HIT-like protein [Cesiribacter andamanensis AMV16]